MKPILFNPRRTSYEFVILALGVLSVVLYLVLHEYHFTTATVPDYRQIVRHKIDSIAASYGIDTDTTATFSRITTDPDLSDVISDSLGTIMARQYIRNHHLQEIVFEANLNSRSAQNSNVNFSFAGNTRRSTQTVQNPNSVLHFWFDGNAQLVGLRIHKTDSSEFSSSDTLKHLPTLLALLPQHLYPTSLVWKKDEHSPLGNIVYTAVVDSMALWTRNLQLYANYTSDDKDDHSYQIGWLETVKPNRIPIQHHSKVYRLVMGYVQSSLPILAFLFTFALIGVFIFRLRKKAVSITLCIATSAIVGIYFFIYSFALLELPIIASILVVFIYFIISFLFVGMPIAGIFSIIREKYADKFYTLLHLRRTPFNSLYVGRSILLGCAAAFIGTAGHLFIYFLLAHTSYDTYFRSFFFNAGLHLLAIQPPYAYIISILFISLLTVILITVVPALTTSIASNRLRFWLSLIGAIISMSLLPLMQSAELTDALISGVFNGLLGFLVFMYIDVLALAIFALVGSAFTILPVFSSSHFFMIALSFFTLVLLVAAVKSYLAPAEHVHEEEYKPRFVYHLEEEKRIHQELAAAQSVQKRLLPATLPRVNNVNVAASCIPALEVGGDYYDFFQLDDHRLGVLIGDVSGKGMSAAFYITLAKGVIVSQIQQSQSPADVLRHVNSLVYGVLERGKFISLIYGILNTVTNEFTYANAGHNPLLVRRVHGTTEFVHTRGMAVGLDNGKIFSTVMQDHVLQLHLGDILLLYTDGVTEAMDYTGHEYGDERMQRAVEQSEATADSIVSALVASVMKHIGKAKQHDDITVVSVQVLAHQQNTLSS